MTPTRKDLLKLIDQERAWLEFLEQTRWFDSRNIRLMSKQKISSRDMKLIKALDEEEWLKSAEKLAKKILHNIVSTRDLWDTVKGCWEEYPNWWIRKYYYNRK
jgi:hypothetical protein